MSADTSDSPREDLLVLGARTLARLAGLPYYRVRTALDAGRFVTVETDGLRGRTCEYVVVGGAADAASRLDRWIATQRSRLPLDDADVPRTNGGHRWFYRSDLDAAAEAGELDVVRDTVQDVGAWLRWAATFMPDGERRAILGTEPEPA